MVNITLLSGGCKCQICLHSRSEKLNLEATGLRARVGKE